MDVVAYHNNAGYGSLKAAPMTPWAQEKYKANAGKQGYDDPTYRCDPPGLPRVALGQAPFEIVQIPGRILILMAKIFILGGQSGWTGDCFPKDPDPSWYGYSVGKWEGDTLVAQTRQASQCTGVGWMVAAHPHSDAMRTVERYRRVDRDTLEPHHEDRGPEGLH